MNLGELAARLQAMRDRIERDGARDAASAMALAGQRIAVTSMRGGAPSPPGTPPARRSGTLARSVRTRPAEGGGARATASVAPHTVYARIQELGGDIHTVRARVLTDGRHFFGTHVHLPKRPYMRPALEKGKADGTYRRVAVAAVQRVIDGR